MTTEDYVYILPEYVQNENRTDLWTNFNTMDGRNAEAKAAFNASFFVSDPIIGRTLGGNKKTTNFFQVEMQLSKSEELYYFKKQIPEKTRRELFNYAQQKVDEFYVRNFYPSLTVPPYLNSSAGFAEFSIFARLGLLICHGPKQNVDERRQLFRMDDRLSTFPKECDFKARNFFSCRCGRK